MYYLVEHPVKLVPGFNNTVTIVAVHDKDKFLCVLEVVSPQWTDLDERAYKKTISKEELVHNSMNQREDTLS